jgi:hypothetical protein
MGSPTIIAIPASIWLHGVEKILTLNLTLLRRTWPPQPIMNFELLEANDYRSGAIAHQPLDLAN